MRRASLLFLAAALALRFYSAWFCVPVCTWDDSMHREQAVGSGLSVAQAIRFIMLPTTTNYVGDKTMGYYLWLVLGLRLFHGLGTPVQTEGCSVSTTERAWQATNVVLLLIQLACVYGLAAWAFRDRTLGASAAALYAVSPIVFGMNRWVLTENHVMAGLWVAIAMAVLVCASREWFVPPAAALAIGMFASLREYALPLVAALVLVAVLALLRDRRWLAGETFAVVVIPYLVGAGYAAASTLEIARHKLFATVDQMQFYNPLPSWLAHNALESWGASLTLLVVAGAVVLVFRYARAVRTRRARTDGLALLWVGVGLLFLATMAGAMITVQRLARPTIPPLIFGSAFVLIGVRVTQVNTAAVRRALSVGAACALCVSWAFLSYHLFVRFDQGRSYVFGVPFTATGLMEFYDHPLWLRPLHGRFDRHYFTDIDLQRLYQRNGMEPQ
jgi:hypothetical protein